MEKCKICFCDTGELHSIYFDDLEYSGVCEDCRNMIDNYLGSDDEAVVALCRKEITSLLELPYLAKDARTLLNNILQSDNYIDEKRKNDRITSKNNLFNKPNEIGDIFWTELVSKLCIGVAVLSLFIGVWVGSLGASNLDGVGALLFFVLSIIGCVAISIVLISFTMMFVEMSRNIKRIADKTDDNKKN